jgi:HD-GYP domain-containing protein (c-di-GMP phosphodiesterase class II)
LGGVATDFSLELTLQSTLNSFLDLCQCDGGSIYTIEKDSGGSDVLRFKALVTRSQGLSEVPADLVEREFALDESTVVGRTALRREFIHERSGSETQVHHHEVLSYRTRNLLSGPLITPRGDLVGVVQLINKLPTQRAGQPNFEADFDARDERVFSAAAAQAALAIENSILLHEQEDLLEGVVEAFVAAVEARDPATAGHSHRVAELCVGLAEAVNRTTPLGGGKRFSESEIRELRFSAMLHDIGKVSVSELVLNKPKKLHPWELENLSLRVELIRARLLLEERGRPSVDVRRRLNLLDAAWAELQKANEPTVLSQEVSGALQAMRSIEAFGQDGRPIRLLSDEEFRKLSIPKGSLSPEERVEMERHVVYTYEILKRVPWSRGLANVPQYAYCHHEKLDGTGYPLRLRAEDIPPQGRIMAICDIYDALVAADRPYKKALPPEKALAIIEADVGRAQLDRDLFRCFVEARVYERVLVEKKRVA